MTQTHPRRTARLVGGALVLAALVAAPFAIAGARGGWHGGPGGCHGARPESAAELRERMDRPADHLLDRVDATDDQRARVDAALDALAPKLWDLHDDKAALHEDVGEALGAEKIDRAALEEIRKDGLALADEASGIVLDAVYEVASALSVEQRRQLLDDAASFHR
ncbi:MAG: Spy/CpxP family protein refolding chaperone [Myxococcota bacterium]